MNQNRQQTATQSRVQCDDCETIYNLEDIIPLCEVQGLSERLDPGSEVPAGECPDEECHALCYLVKDKPHVTVSNRKPARVRVTRTR